ncbi:LTA synthase family protein [Pseudoflavitalea sp. X16]|uniref:sulfatase-like hydrolase/transferase n=1 Tax=Paraflavitalea devenefica TaxID=2716334 RepID=UPI0014212405|nr:sulfatase-like hydrolase/transferase [Paraflavitalea devenefica]NII23593.1 LTA synthase family protein [Paraflavitalea devenefica]
MLTAPLKKLFTTNWHFMGVILFFALHGYAEYGLFISPGAVLWLLAKLIGGGLILFGLGNWLFRSKRKAGLFTSLFFIILLFFGAFQDTFEGLPLLHKLSPRKILAPVCLLVLIVVFFLIRRTKWPLNRPVLFINVLLVVYMLIDVGTLVGHTVAPPNWYPQPLPAQLTVCDTCAKPPVYFIILDEYMGSYGLQQYYGYNNQLFEDSLQQQGFRVLQHTRSNYPYTVYSMFSTLNMKYLAIGNVHKREHDTYRMSVTGIKFNPVCDYLNSLGYTIFNHSPFELKQQQSAYRSILLADNINLLTSQTIWSRLAPDVPNRLAKAGIMPSLVHRIDDDFMRNNERMLQETLNKAAQPGHAPAFHYVHVMMPHNPYLADSTGRRTIPYAFRKSVTQQEGDNDYLQYLVYTNRRILRFIRELQQLEKGKAVILLMSDHGSRSTLHKDKKLMYYNLNAVYLPNGNYTGWYDGMTNVNQFRVLFNTLFHQRLPVLKDSIVY